MKFIANEVNKYVVRKIDPSQDPSINKLIVPGNVAKAQDADPTGAWGEVSAECVEDLAQVDEADALFGKRTNVSSSNDKHANQEVSFLLQRIEDFPGLMILASNFKSNIDEAFLRRFHAIIQFPMPNAQERLKLWNQCLPASVPYSADNLPLTKLAETYEMSGASILNVMQYASLRALSRDDRTLFGQDLMDEIRRELRKEEKTL